MKFTDFESSYSLARKIFRLPQVPDLLPAALIFRFNVFAGWFHVEVKTKVAKLYSRRDGKGVDGFSGLKSW